ncbi:hypothetical protein Psi02_70360 [Planotetraspora silvatica]|uniref:Uncharacterized protein n=1 Tax=Planotetraspora silvatica TaxID=234614 RepID=A0A8J3USP5_9ACTN|nr:hypothetical protein Psi02_70360 [Planotetraspora silvatica]
MAPHAGVFDAVLRMRPDAMPGDGLGTDPNVVPQRLQGLPIRSGAIVAGLSIPRSGSKAGDLRVPLAERAEDRSVPAIVSVDGNGLLAWGYGSLPFGHQLEAGRWFSNPR